MEVTCRLCYERRVKAWQKARAGNGLTEAEWPKPIAPRFEDADALREHTKRIHGGRS